MAVVLVLLVAPILILAFLIAIWLVLARTNKPLPQGFRKFFSTKYDTVVKSFGYTLMFFSLIFFVICFMTWLSFVRSGTGENGLLFMSYFFGFSSLDISLAMLINKKFQAFEG